MAGTIDARGPVSRAQERLSSGPAWLRDRRAAAWDAFTALPMPSRSRDEDWRRTDIGALKLDEFDAGAADPAARGVLTAAMRAQRDAADAGATFAAPTEGGVEVDDPAGQVGGGVVVTSLEQAAVDHAAVLQNALAASAAGESKFLALWHALWSGGVFIHVPAGVSAAAPVWVAHALAGDHALGLPATVVVLEEGATLSLVEAFASPRDAVPVLGNALTLMSAGRGARLDYCTVQDMGPGAWHMATHRATLGREASLRFFGATLGARLQKAYWEAILAGEGAEASIAGVCFGDQDQHLDHQSLQAHRAPHTHSELLLKSAVRDTARSVYSGLIMVEREAQHTDGYVQNRNLILSRGAKADSVPRLEIKANDVRCSHGAATGHIDDEQRFYLESRGVPREEADRIIVRGFLDDALRKAPHAGFAALVGGLLDEEIAGRNQAGVAA